MKSGLFRLTLSAAFFAGSIAWTSAQTPRHLFLDPALLQKSDQTTLHINPPEQREIVIRADRPWEALMISFFLTIREEEGKLRLWYICRDADNQPNVAYAESKDGVTWIKPNLGIVNYHGSTDNNLVGIPSVEGVVFVDPRAGSAQEKYVYVTRVKHSNAMVRYFSADGLRWQRDAEPLFKLVSDTQNVTFWDANLGRYVLYLRGRSSKPGSKGIWRTVKRLTAENLTKPLPLAAAAPEDEKNEAPSDDGIPVVLAADEKDPAGSDIYNISAQPYPLDPRWYLGFPSFFQREKNPANPGASNWGRLEVQFVGSRDGIQWQRYDRQPYVAPGLEGSESSNVVFMGTGMVIRGDEIWQYGTGFESHHGDVEARKQKTDGVIYRYTQRVDGFVSLDFAEAPAKCTTMPVNPNGNRLLLNVDTGALGQLRVGLLDKDGNAIPGFGTEDCVVIRSNSTHHQVSWKGRKELSALKGADVQVSFEGSRAKLYSFRFEP